MPQNHLHTQLNDWLETNYQRLLHSVKKNITKGMMREYASDLLIMVIEQLYKIDEDKLQQILDDELLENYILRGCALQIKSSTSPFYMIFRKFKMGARELDFDGDDTEKGGNDFLIQYSMDNQIDIENEPEFLQCFAREFNNPDNWYYKIILSEKYLNGLTYEQIADKYGISPSSLTKDIKRAFKYFREKCDIYPNY